MWNVCWLLGASVFLGHVQTVEYLCVYVWGKMLVAGKLIAMKAT